MTYNKLALRDPTDMHILRSQPTTETCSHVKQPTTRRVERYRNISYVDL